MTLYKRTPIVVDDRPLHTFTTMSLTAHQRTTLSYIREFQKKKGYSPSLSDLAEAFGVKSKNAIAKVINALVRGKYLEKDPKGRIKMMEVPEEESTPMLRLPLFGPIAAGFAAPVEEHAEEIMNLDTYLVSDRSNTFLLRVKGESMIDAGIHDGDMVVVERDKTPKVGDIVVGVLDGSFTLKTLKRDKGKYYLQAENRDYPDLHALDELRVAGVVRAVLRRY